MPHLQHAISFRWLHYLLLAAMLGSFILVTFVAYWLIRSQESFALRIQTQSDAAQIAQGLNAEIARQISPICALKYRWLGGVLPGDIEMADIAANKLAEWPAYLFVGGLNSAGDSIWVRSAVAATQATSRPTIQSPHWRELVEQARSSAFEAAATFIDPGANQPMLDIVVPLFPQSFQPDAPSNCPYIFARLALEPTLAEVITDHLRREYNCELSSGNSPLFSLGPPHGDGEEFADAQLIHVANTPLQLRLWPNDLTIATRIDRIGRFVLLSGIAAAFLFTAALWQVLRHRLRSSHQLRSYLAALESLNELSTAISAKLGSGRQVLDQLASLAHQLLRMSRSGIALLDEHAQTLRVFGFAGDIPKDAPTIDLLDGMPVPKQCLQTGQVVFIEDTTRSSLPLNQDVVRLFHARAAILIPLHIEGRCIGIMGLSDSQPRRFTDADRRLAQLLGSQASVILANNRLYDQTHRDAQTKATLLRELHHRVKNNLAGIVGLLAINQPDLPPATRHWLDRAVERIQMMAKAHDLFIGGLDRVGLRQLVEQILPALAVIKPPGVFLLNHVPDDGCHFTTPQAVSLATTLHELCTNAILHGLTDHGTLAVQARNTPNSIVIDVIDDGRGLPPDLLSPPPPSSTPATPDQRSIGLQLVRELVGRELQGTLRLLARPGGGTIASIELPLPRDTI